MKIIFSLVCLLWVFVETPNYRATYRLSYHPDSTNLQRTGQEVFFLFVKGNNSSFFASENFFKRDSVSALIKAGSLSEGDIVTNSQNRFKTNFPQYTCKEYATQSVKIYETIGLLPYVYSFSKPFEWTVTTDKDSVAGYLCTKATTRYAGRDYEAWFAPEIPISDGPYVFSGLPGLVVKLNDTRKHYAFVLEQFGTYTSKIAEIPTYRKQQPAFISGAKAFSLREESRKDPFGYLNRTMGGALDNMTFQRNGSSEKLPLRAAAPDRSWNNNPLELK